MLLPSRLHEVYHMRSDAIAPRAYPRHFGLVASKKEEHTVTIDQAVIRKAAGLPEGVRISSAWVDLKGEVSVSYEEESKGTGLGTFFLGNTGGVR
jgi:hypothetical protein